MSVLRFGARNGDRAWVACAARVCSICWLIGLIVIAFPVGLGGRVGLAQTGQVQNDKAQTGQDQAQDEAQTEDSAAAVSVPESATAVPSPPSANSKPKQAAVPPGAQAGVPPGVQAAIPEAVKSEAATAAPAQAALPGKPLDPNQKAVADASTNLLDLANSLKKEVDKTSADTLSIAVIRKANEIEQLARKMRAQ